MLSAEYFDRLNAATAYFPSGIIAGNDMAEMDGEDDGEGEGEEEYEDQRQVGYYQDMRGEGAL